MAQTVSAAQNSTASAPGRPFEKGQSGNPGGRPKGLAAKVRELAPAGDLTAFYVQVWQGDAKALGAKPSLRDRREAADWLADRGYGKAASFAPVEDGDPLELEGIDREIARVADELAARRETQAAGRAPQGGVAGNGTAGAASA